MSTIVNKITQLKKAGSSAKGGSEFVIETIDSLIAKLNQLKTKVIYLSNLQSCLQYKKMLEAEDYLIDVMRKRLSHLKRVIEN